MVAEISARGVGSAPLAQVTHPRRSARFSEQFAELTSQFTGQPLDVSFRNLVGPLPAQDLTHGLFPYPARLVRHIPMFLLGSSDFATPGSVVFDPFCGSGTVLVEAQAWGHDGIGVDANPIAVLATKVKTTAVDGRLLDETIARVRSRALNYRSAAIPAQFLEKWYSESALSALARIARALSQEAECSPERDCVALAFALSSRALAWTDARVPVPVLRVPDKPRESFRNVWSTFDAACRRVATGVSTDRPRSHAVEVFEGDARGLDRIVGLEIDRPAVIISSPPYGAAQKYVRSTSLEAGWLGLTNGRGTIELERNSIGREHLSQGERNPDSSVLSSDLRQVIGKISSSNVDRGAIYTNYFLDMSLAFANAVDTFPTVERIALIGGTNVAGGVPVETHVHLADMVAAQGFKLTLTMRDSIRGRALLTRRKGDAVPSAFEYVHILEREGETE